MTDFNFNPLDFDKNAKVQSFVGLNLSTWCNIDNI